MCFDKINAFNYATRIKVVIYEGTACYINAEKSNNVAKLIVVQLSMKHNLVMDFLLVISHRQI